MNFSKTANALEDHAKDDHTIYNILDRHLNLIDKATICENSIFKREHCKEKYETYLMYAFRKYKAANYHYGNVIRFLNEDKESYENHIIKLKEFQNTHKMLDGINIKVMEKVSRCRRSSDIYIYEISAFLASIRSCLDFLTIVSSMYLSGMESVDSVSSIIKKIRTSDFTCTIFECFKKHTEWIELLRKYRDKLIHNLTLSASSGYEHHTKNGKEKLVIYPVVIRTDIKDLPDRKFIPDTRNTIFHNDGEVFDVQASEVIIRNGDEEELQDFEIKFLAPIGYMEVSEFLADHLEAYIKFFTDLIAAFEQLDFQKIKVGH